MIFKSLFFVLMFFSSFVYSDAGGPDYFFVKNVKKGDFLNLREEPNHKSKITGKLLPSTRSIKNMGCVQVKDGKVIADVTDMPLGHLWCKIKYKEFEGWANSSFLSEQEN